MRNKVLWTLPVVVLAVMLGGAVKTYAGVGESGRGWLWGGSESPATLGWVSMNNVDENGVAVNGAVSYGVNIPVLDGAVTGYAWSENYGWVSFNSADMAGCPFGGALKAGNNLVGGARVLSIRDGGVNAGGWLGCVSLSSVSAGSPIPYGVEISKMDGTGLNPTYAWSDELGWIDFSRAKVVAVAAVDTLKVCPTNPVLTQGTVNYPMHAYYNTGTDCTNTANEVTTLATWSSNNTGAVTIGSSTGRANAPITGNANPDSAVITATYNAETKSVTAVVPGLSSACSCSPADASVCSGVPFTSNTPAGCSPSVSCIGTQVCAGSSNKWKEIAPTN